MLQICLTVGLGSGPWRRRGLEGKPPQNFQNVALCHLITFHMGVLSLSVFLHFHLFKRSKLSGSENKVFKLHLKQVGDHFTFYHRDK